jgi:lincosamide nucleotidyltransferase A/C/D/E
MMRAADVLDVLARLGGAGVTAWVDGGWGIDALLGETTREHSDLDLVVLLDEIEVVRATLWHAGYAAILRDWLPTALALADRAGREVDLHPITGTAEHGGEQAQVDGGTFFYPPPVPGSIAGRPVRCVDPETQVRCHNGYPLTDKDRRDLARLRDRRLA